VLCYLSPEQTGRMNRAIDYRSDFYSLGVTLYELLTGARPFESDDPLELIHGHVARTPTFPTEINPDIPEVLSRIIMTLLAKTAEERYQSALGLRTDLERCRHAWASLGHMPTFALRERDVSERFLLPQKLYGRVLEVEALADAFERVCDGPAAMVVVAGYAGIGKTALIQELYKPLARQRGYFIAGKFDQIVRNIPHGALIQAFRGLIQQLLAESEERLTAWRTRLASALGPNGGVLVEVMPEIELIVGPQASPPLLGPPEAQNRFQRVFQQLVGAIARREHPLVVFLDDLQWADSATLNLLMPLLTVSDVRCLLVIGAFRDNEVDAAHPLTAVLQRLGAAGARLDRIVLKPLGLSDLTLLIQDTLHSDVADAERLAALVLQKTDGNPFFVRQFLKTLCQDGLLVFDDRLGRWTVRMEARVAAMTDNVIDLMTGKIQKLPPDTQQALMLAACIGNPIDPRSLAIVGRQSLQAALDSLQDALTEGLIHAVDPPYGSREAADRDVDAPTLPTYVFLHDRVQQAAYSLIPAADLPNVHLTAGRLLLERSGVSGEDRLFDIVHHLNRGSALMTDEAERLRLAQLNLDAGRKAKSATAYQVALGFFQTGLGFLTEEQWESAYALAFSLHLEAAESLYLCGEFEAAERDFNRLLAGARTPLDKAQIHALKILQYEHTSRYADAIRAGREGIGLFGIAFPDRPEERQAALDSELATIQTLLHERPIDSVIDLPTMTDPEARALMRLLGNLHTSCFLSGDKPLTLLNTATMVRLSLSHGHLAESAYAYALHAAMLEGPLREDFRAAYEYGILALRLSERLQDPALRAKVLMMFAWAVSLWRMPLEASFAHTREAFRLGNETGLFVDAAWALFNEIWFALLTCRDLGSFSETYASHVDYSVRIKMPHIADAKRVILQWGKALQGQTKHPCSLTDAHFDEDVYSRTYTGQRLFEMFLHVAKLGVQYTFDEYEAAQQTAQRAETVIQNDFKGTIWDALRVFYHALSLTALHPATVGEVDPDLQGRLAACNARLRRWAENSPHNFEPWHLIASAETARVAGRVGEAPALYEAAVDSAARYERPRERALALELCAKFWQARGQVRTARAFMVEAVDGYARWGAAAKVTALRQRYADLLDQSIPSASREPSARASHIETPLKALDLTTAMKAAQAIAGEIELEKLLATLMRIALENAGAERGCLILEHEGQALVHAQGTLEAAEAMPAGGVPLAEVPDLPRSIVSYVRRTLGALVLVDARTDDRYADDPCVRRRQLRSVLCVPVINQGRLRGVLYLENNLTAGAFTPERSELMQILASQAAISLENARLYDAMKAEVGARRRAEEMLREVAEGTASATGQQFFDSLVRHLASALGVRYAFVAECVDPGRRRARTLAFWQGDRPGENFAYDVAGTPCEGVVGGEVGCYSEGVQQRFPEDRDLVGLGAESYLAVPIVEAAGRLIGHLAVLDIKRMNVDEQAISVLQTFAGRAGAEMQRLQAETDLRTALTEVERLKNRLQAENVYLQEEIHRQHNFVEMVGNSPALLAVFRKIEQVAPTDSTVLITGETGTGKELVARAIHDRSARKDRPLVKVNCSAISAGLVESELFGHVKGAFTGAIERRVGRFELADGGTIFLDEVGELPLETQVKLLRVLQEQEFEVVGSSKTLRVDVRVIAATNRGLDEAVEKSRFRPDLFYRLNVFPLQVPSLRDRRTDIPQLVLFFLSRLAKRYGKKVDAVSHATMERLLAYSWPGNIRELQNIIERAVILCTGSLLELDADLLPTTTGGREPAAADTPTTLATPIKGDAAAPTGGAAGLSTLEEVERNHIITALRQTRGVIEGPKGAAKILKLHPNTLRSRMQKLGIERRRHEMS
jgi:predicted ATPase/GAF domain-containing protein